MNGFFLLQSYLFHFFAQSITRLLYFRFFFELYLLPVEHPDIVLISFHVLLPLVKTDLVLSLKIVQNSLAAEIHPRALLAAYHFLQLLDCLTLRLPVENCISSEIPLLQWVAHSLILLIALFREKPSILNAILEGMRKIHGVFG